MSASKSFPLDLSISQPDLDLITLVGALALVFPSHIAIIIWNQI